MYIDSNKESFNEGWSFVSPGKANEENLINLPDCAESVDLPHAWNEIGWNYENWVPTEPKGVGYYYKKLDSSQSGTLRFEGVSALCEIYLDGVKIGENIGAYKPFDVILPQLSAENDNLLCVKVTDKPSLDLLSNDCGDAFAVSPRYMPWSVSMGSSLDAGGIWRDVWMIKSDNLLNLINLNASVDTIDLSPVWAGGKPAGATISYELSDSEGEVVWRATVDSCEAIRERIDGVVSWHPRNPVLYTLESKLELDGEVVQTIQQPVGFWDIQVRDSEFHVNGKPYFLRGQNGFPHTSIAHDREYIGRYVSQVKAQGVEISRFHTEPPSHAWLDECDRQGIMVIFEMALHGSMGCYPFENPVFKKNVEEEMLELIREYRRHPSIAMWCLGNEMIVSCERDVGLYDNLLPILDDWIGKIRPLSRRPVVPNSGGDGANLYRGSVGDVDDIHQYGGWYTETLGDLKYFEEVVQKNDMLFQPMIVTESVAAYTNNDGEFFVTGSDARQKKVVMQRLGRLDDFKEDCLALQAFILKEYAEMMWRLRRSDTNAGGYIPFGQYTWFFDPFDKSEKGMGVKPIWDVYRKVMSPVHVQLECWDRHVESGDELPVTLHVCNEDIEFLKGIDVKVEISQGANVLWNSELSVDYHDKVLKRVRLNVSGFDHEHLTVKVISQGECVAENYLDITIYSSVKSETNKMACQVYDPTNSLSGFAEFCDMKSVDFMALDIELPLIIGAHAVDDTVRYYSENILNWCKRGGKIIVLEQNPTHLTKNLLNCGIDAVRCLQPYWSRWAANLVKHADRVDIVDELHPFFDGIRQTDMARWNRDTFIAHSYLLPITIEPEDKVLLSVCDGLSDTELMPVEHPDIPADTSLVMIEKFIGEGRITFCQALLGTKFEYEPVAKQLLINMINNYSR